MSRSLLQNVYLFKTLTADELGAVSEIAQTDKLQNGEAIFMRGEPAKALFLIKFGTVRIQQSLSTGENIDVATLGTGSHFGEMPFIDGEPRSATAIAAETCELVAIPYEKLEHLLSQNITIANKFYREISKFMCARLRATTSDLGFSREKNLSHF